MHFLAQLEYMPKIQILYLVHHTHGHTDTVTCRQIHMHRYTDTHVQTPFSHFVLFGFLILAYMKTQTHTHWQIQIHTYRCTHRHMYVSGCVLINKVKQMFQQSFFEFSFNKSENPFVFTQIQHHSMPSAWTIQRNLY